MQSILTRRLLFTLTLFATLAMISSEADARGGRGGGRGGGRAGASGGSRNFSSRSGGGAVANRGNVSGQFGAGQFGGSATGGAGLADKGQLQGMLGQTSGALQSGQRSGKFSKQQGQHQQNAQSKATEFQGGSKPFTASWYAQHPNAWQATHPHAGAAAVATTATVAAWVGAPYYAPASSGDSSTTIIYEAAAEAAPEAAALAPIAAPANAVSAAQAQPTNAEAWFPVGIYQLATSKGAPALLMLQLVVDHQGTLRGVYYDSITDTSHNLVGTLNPSTQLAQWRLESNSQVTFQASLAELTQPAGTVQVNIAAGPQQWQLARVESP